MSDYPKSNCRLKCRPYTNQVKTLQFLLEYENVGIKVQNTPKWTLSANGNFVNSPFDGKVSSDTTYPNVPIYNEEWNICSIVSFQCTFLEYNIVTLGVSSSKCRSGKYSEWNRRFLTF